MGNSDTAPLPIGDGLCVFEIDGDREDTVDIATAQAFVDAARYLILTCLNGGTTRAGGKVTGLGMWEPLPNNSSLYTSVHRQHGVSW